MKKLGGILIIFSLVATFFVVKTSYAQNCANISSFGAVTLNVPDLTKTNEQVLWVRIQTPDKESKILADVNGECLEINGGEISVGKWSWQTVTTGGVVQTINFAKTSGNEIKLIGVNAGVKIDRVLITDKECHPQDFGNLCQSGVELTQSSALEITELSPITEPISGKVVLSNTPSENSDLLTSVEYFSGGKRVQLSKQVEPFDTTLLTNGKHTVYITTTLNDGEKIKESIVVDIKNPQNSFSSIARWIKLNKNSLIIAILFLGFVVIIFAIIKLIKSSHKKRKHRKFHGF